MNEVIMGIRVIKMYTWDYAFKKLIAKLRRFVSFKDSNCTVTILTPIHWSTDYFIIVYSQFSIIVLSL